MDEFKALDEKIKSGDYSDEEEKKFSDLSLKYAQNQVRGFNYTEMQQNQLFKEEMKEIKSASEFILGTA